MILKTMTPIRSIERKSRRDETKLSELRFSQDYQDYQDCVVKSRRDGTLLTVDAIYGRDAACHVSTSPVGTVLVRDNVLSLRDI